MKHQSFLAFVIFLITICFGECGAQPVYRSFAEISPDPEIAPHIAGYVKYATEVRNNIADSDSQMLMESHLTALERLATDDPERMTLQFLAFLINMHSGKNSPTADIGIPRNELYRLLKLLPCDSDARLRAILPFMWTRAMIDILAVAGPMSKTPPIYIDVPTYFNLPNFDDNLERQATLAILGHFERGEPCQQTKPPQTGEDKYTFAAYAAFLKKHGADPCAGEVGGLISYMMFWDPILALSALSSVYETDPEKLKELRKLEAKLAKLKTEGRGGVPPIKGGWFLGGLRQRNREKRLAGYAEELSKHEAWWVRLFAADLVRRYPEARKAKTITRLQNDKCGLIILASSWPPR